MKKRIPTMLLALLLVLAAAPYASAEEPDACADAYLNVQPSGLAADGSAMLVTDLYNKVIWRVSDGKAEIMAGTIAAPDAAGVPSGACVDGSLTEARFIEPWAITAFLDGWAVTDAAANVVRYVTEKGVFTLAGSGKAGKANGLGTTASFSYPTGLATDDKGNLYVADTGNGMIRMITKTGMVSVFASGLREPTGLSWQGGALYVAETGANRICRVTSGKIETVCGGEEGFADGPVAAAGLSAPQGVLALADGSLLIADTMNGAVRCVADGRVRTLAASEDDAAELVFPRGMLVQGDGLAVSDPFSGRIHTVVPEDSTFSDVSASAWYADAVAKASKWGMVRGSGSGEFAPDRTMSRAETVTVLMRLTLMRDRTQILTGDEAFPDVAEDAWYAEAVRWAASRKIAVGGTDGQFRPDGAISRAELLTMLYRYAAAEGLDQYNGTAEVLNSYSDSEAVPDYARTAMAWACDRGILYGSDGRLMPGAPASRAEAVQLLVRFAECFGL